MSIAFPGGALAAVSLTYDDALPVHRDVVAPLLSRHGLRSTFYVPIWSDLREHPAAWRNVASQGHELGNHSCFHPCTRSVVGTWVDPQHDLARYTAVGLERELEVANAFLGLIDGRSERSFGNTCHEETFGAKREPMRPILARLFPAARGGCTGKPASGAFDLLSIGCAGADGATAAQLLNLVDSAIRLRGWLILCMHGVGAGTHGLFIDPAEHDALIAGLAERRAQVFTAPVIEVARVVRSARAQAPAPGMPTLRSPRGFAPRSNLRATDTTAAVATKAAAANTARTKSTGTKATKTTQAKPSATAAGKRAKKPRA